MYTLLDLCKKLYPIRSCSLKLSDKNIQSGKFRVCLEYHVGNCWVPCVGKQEKSDYENSIASIRHVLKGNLSEVKEELKKRMKDAAESLAFEKADLIKSKLKSLEKYQAKSTVVNPTITNVDVFSIISDSTSAYVNCMNIVKGSIVKGQTFEIKKQVAEGDEEVLQSAIPLIREVFRSKSKELILPFDLGLEEGLRGVVPKKGDKKRLLEMSEKNVLFFMEYVIAAQECLSQLLLLPRQVC